MEQTRTINDGLILGKTALQELRRINSINFPEPLQAGFAVLKAPDIPSVLVEVGYITNPKEEKLLSDTRFQSKVANALKQSVIRFLRKIQPKTAFSKEAELIFLSSSRR
jgi:N-acetylmuramoyl-L-alanine amidase